jgi:hypothetical protein
MKVRWRTNENPTPPTEGGMGHPREDISEASQRRGPAACRFYDATDAGGFRRDAIP